MIDTPRVVATPEGIELSLSVAGPVARARAWVIDLLIRLVVYMAVGTALSAMGGFGSGIILITLFLIEWGYPILFEVYWRGATPGKRATHLRVIYDDGTPVGWRGAVVRNTVRAVDFLPLFYSVGLIAMLLNRDFKRLGDLAAGTVVVHVPHVSNAVRAKQARAASQANNAMTAGVAALPALTLSEQRAIVSFEERLWRWSKERADELAGHADAAIGETPGNSATERMVALAHAVSGKRPTAAAGSPRHGTLQK